MFVLWALYMSLLPIGQEWLSYGWDIQILETGFLAMMLCPLWDARPFPGRAPPVLIIWLYRWLIFRIMLGAGLIKWRGDSCWRELTALYYHYETQPVPNPLSPLLHFMPKWFHQAGVAWNHIVELVVPWFGFLGRWPQRLLAIRWPRFRRPDSAWGVFLCPRHIAGVLMVSFQGILILSGNLSFLNWLSIIPALACLDDAFWKRVLPGFLVKMAAKSAEERLPASRGHLVASVIYTGVVVWLSLGPVENLISSEQAMNTSFDRLHLVNTYGAFGTVDRERFELVFEGTTDEVAGPLSDWRTYNFKAKPTDPMRAPGDHHAVSLSPRLGRLVSVAPGRWPQSMGAKFHLEAPAQPPRHAQPPRGQSFPRQAAEIHPRARLSLPVRTARQRGWRVVDS
jgi:hypothetical protein